MSNSYNNNFIINNISASNDQYTKSSGVGQIPIILSLNSVINLRSKQEAYNLSLGK